jgi:hypothetical protein
MNLKRVLIIVVLIYGVVSAWMITTPYLKNAMFSNDLDDIARVLSVEGELEKAKNQVRKAIQVHEIPAAEENITVIRDENTMQVLIEVRYSVPVTTPFGLYTHTWNFSPRVEKGIVRVPRPGG